MTGKALIIAAMLAGCAGDLSRLPHRWPKRDQILGATFVALTVIDIAQTTGPGGIATICMEQNPILGQCGTKVPPWAYFTGVYYMLFATSVLPDHLRTGVIAGAVGVEAFTVWDNNRQGWDYFGNPKPGFEHIGD